MDNNAIFTHPFRPFMRPHIDADFEILILGSFPPLKLAIPFYYGGATNQLWAKILGAVYNRRLDTLEERQTLLVKKRIAMADIILKCGRIRPNSSLDKDLKIEEYTDIAGYLEQNPSIQKIFFTSRFVEAEFSKQWGNAIMEKSISTGYLPSPSGRNPMKIKDKIEIYRSQLLK